MAAQSLQPSSVGLARTVEGPSAAHPDSSRGLSNCRIHRNPVRVESRHHRNPVTVIGPGPLYHIGIQSSSNSVPSPHRSISRVESHASVNSSHPILPGHSWRPSLSSRHPSAWPAPSRVQVQPIRTHQEAYRIVESIEIRCEWNPGIIEIR